MPAAFAHLYFGKQVLANLNPNTKQLIKRNKELFYIGLHGPDILFYYRPIPPNAINSVGYDMHSEDAMGFFKRCRKVVNKSLDKEAALAYVLGFICHFTLDSECHGYIEEMINKIGVTHSEIETELDNYLMRRQHIIPQDFDPTAHLNPSQKNAAIIAPFFYLTPELTAKSISSMKKYCNMFRTIFGWKRALILVGLMLTGAYNTVSGMFINRRSNPLCRESNIELRHKVKNSIPTAQELIASYMAYQNGQANLSARFQRNYK